MIAESLRHYLGDVSYGDEKKVVVEISGIHYDIDEVDDLPDVVVIRLGGEATPEDE